MIEIRDKRFIIDGEPRLIVGGEIHYFRLKREDWQDRIAKLKAAGCNAVASYIPWLCHEPVEGRCDLEGKTRPELDVGAFIDLCEENDLCFFARPGPFVMAELKNEGLPYWIYTKYPEIVPITWDGKPAPTRTVDYLAPGFLHEVRRWYRAVMPVIAARLQPRGGNVIAVQLDNEIGMLSWMTRSPDLTDSLLDDFAAYLGRRYDDQALRARYPFVLQNAQIRNAEFRSPREQFAPRVLRDLGHYMRDRFARYAAALRSYAEEFGITGVPLVINVHGTEAGRGLDFPMGISQLYESYAQAPGYLAGSDHYLGDLTTRNFHDLYLMNAFMDAMNRSGEPLTSVEFQCETAPHGGGNYCSRHDPSTLDLKTRMCLAQGNRLINYYLFAGGINYHLDEPAHDGNDRISFTGERHGVAAPLNPEGSLTQSYHTLSRVLEGVTAVSDKLADMDEEHDEPAFAFIPDYYMTECSYPASNSMSAIVANLEANRGTAAWDNLARALLLANFRFGAVDIQNGPLDPQTIPVLVLASAGYMDRDVQQKIVHYLTGGGRLLLYGEVPFSDMEGAPCTALADALGLKQAGHRTASRYYYLSVCTEGWAAPHPEVPVVRAQTFQPTGGEVIMRVVDTREACGLEVGVGRGKAVLITTPYDCDIPLFKTALERLGVRPAFSHDCPDYGIFMTTTASPRGYRFLYLLNLDGVEKTVHIAENGLDLFGGHPITLGRREGTTLPLSVSFGDVRVLYSTAEITRVESQAIEFRLTRERNALALETGREILAGDDYTVERQGDITFVTSNRQTSREGRLKVRWR
ncbi:MAG TPA: beta-galactosidase [Chloroflexia bacterium]|nr:beta-galactosidase [Chloroflexia bacterium]